MKLDEASSVETKIEILRNAVEFLEFRYPGNAAAEALREEKLNQLRWLESQIS